MIDFFQPTHPFGAQTLRLVAEAQQGGGDVFDIARLCRGLEPGDKEGWEKAWLAPEDRGRDPREKRGISAFSHARNSRHFEGEQLPDRVSRRPSQPRRDSASFPEYFYRIIT